MTTRELARFFVRFQALCFLFYAIYEMTGFGSALRSLQTVHEFTELDSAAAETFWILMSRVTLQLGAAALLYGWTEKVIDFVAKGPGKKEAPRPGEAGK